MEGEGETADLRFEISEAGAGAEAEAEAEVIEGDDEEFEALVNVPDERDAPANASTEDHDRSVAVRVAASCCSWLV